MVKFTNTLSLLLLSLLTAPLLSLAQQQNSGTNMLLAKHSPAPWSVLRYAPSGSNTPEWTVVDAGTLSGGTTYTITTMAPPAADLDQVRNGGATTPVSPAPYVNGAANETQAHNAEGWGIPYRLRFTNLELGTNVVDIEWDTRHSSRNALDFITYFDLLDFPAGTHMSTYGHVQEVINPRLGVFSSIVDSSFFDIPKPNLPTTLATGASRSPSAEWDLLEAAGKQKLLIYNGTITSATYLVQDPLNGEAQTSTSMRIVFTADDPTVIIAWSGHIAARRNWGTGNSAQDVSGSPYHTRLLSLNGKGGNQDRALAAKAVRVPPECAIIADTVCREAASIQFCYDGSATNKTFLWTIVSGSNSAGAQISGSATGSCVTLVPTGTDFVGGGSVTVNLAVTEDGVTTNCQATGRIFAQPATPTFTVNEATLCGTLAKPEIVVCNPLPNATYRLIQAGGYDSTKTTGSSPGELKFRGLTVATDFKLVVVDSNGCVSDTADCDNQVSTCPAVTLNSLEKSTNTTVLTEASVVRNTIEPAMPPVKELQVQAYPNPYYSSVNFQLVSPVSGKATLEIYDLMGRRLAVVYQGSLDAGIQKNINYNLPPAQRVPMIYKLSVGSSSSRGKLMPSISQEP